MSDLQDLYQEVIIDHSKHPRNFHALEGANRKAEGYNPLCGDRLTLYLQVVDDHIKDVSFEGKGCAISKASASMMTLAVKGKTKAEAEDLFQKFHEMLAGSSRQEFDSKQLGKLAVFSGVSEFPVRVKCATLAWHTLHSGLESKTKQTVTTE